MSDSYRHGRYRQLRVRGGKRTLPIYGEGEDAGKWYRCWHCGFINNADRNNVGDGDGRTYTDFTTTSHGKADSSDPDNAYVVLDGINEGHVSLKTDNGQDVVPHSFAVQGTGCSLCHSQNYR